MENALIDQPAAVHSSAPIRGPEPQTVSKPRRVRMFDARWLVMICLLLGASGVLRYWREFQFAAIKSDHEESPFPIKDISPVLGNWRLVEGAEVQLDPNIARVAGSSDHFVRQYENTTTGQKMNVLVLYGLAQLVWGHTPEVCYPSSGYRPMMPPRDMEIPRKFGGSATFRKGVYGLTRGGAASYSEAFYSFLNGGTWTPDMESRWKQFRYFPGMFKIQVEHQVDSLEEHGVEACNDLLAALVDEIESRTQAASSSSK